MLSWLIALSILIPVSFLAVSAAIVSIISNKIRSFSTLVILYLFCNALLDIFISIPNIFSSNDGLCTFAGVLHKFLLIQNVEMASSLALILYQLLFGTVLADGSINEFRKAYGYRLELALCLPGILISVLPTFYSSSAYISINSIDDEFANCGISPTFYDVQSNEWTVDIAFVFVWIIMISNVLLFGYMIHRLINMRTGLVSRLVRIFGFYPVANILTWIPFSITRISDNILSPNRIEVFARGILYGVIYFLTLPDLLARDLMISDVNFNISGMNTTILSASTVDRETYAKSISTIHDRPSIVEFSGRPTLEKLKLGNIANPIRQSAQSDINSTLL